MEGDGLFPWAPSAIMFNTDTRYYGWIYQPNSSNTGVDNKPNFMSMKSPWRDGDRAGVSINIDTNEISFYYKGDNIWTIKSPVEIGDKHHPTVTMYHTGMQARVHFDGP